MGAMQQIAVAELLCGMLLLATSIAGWTGRPGPVGYIGVRTSSTKASRHAWIASQRAAAPWNLTAALGLILCGFGVLKWGWDGWWMALLNAPAITLMICAVAKADRCARDNVLSPQPH